MNKYFSAFRYLSVGLLFLFAFAANGYAQTSAEQSDETRNPYILKKNSFVISLTNGVSRARFNTEIGEDEVSGGFGMMHHLNFDYHFTLGDHFSLNVGAGFGVLPFSFDIAEKGDFMGNQGWNYWQKVRLFARGKLNLGLNYHRWINQKWGWRVATNTGIFRLGQQSVSTGSFFGEDYSQYNYTMNYFSEKGSYGFLSFHGGIDRVMKDDNILSLELGYTQGFRPQYQGDYNLYNGVSRGTLLNNGSSFDVTVAYRFTRAGKMELAERFVYSDTTDFRQGKKEFKKKRREILPGAQFYRASAGLFFGRTVVKDKGLGVESSAFPSWIVELDYQKELENHMFWQAGFNTSEYWNSTKMTDSYGFGGNAFVASSVYGGIGYRLVGKRNNINFLNLSAGAALSFHYSQKGPSGSSSTFIVNPDETFTTTYAGLRTTDKRFFPTLYLNLSRDFQLTRSVYFTFDYRLNVGFVSAERTDARLYAPPTYEEFTSIRSDLNGTANAFQFGLKIKLDP